MTINLKTVIALLVFTFTPPTVALDDGDGTSNNCNNYNALNNPYFGDTHVHTTYSVDAFINGTDTTPEQAYQFSGGALLGLHPFNEIGEPSRFAQLDRPLDFAMVSDHAEFFGEQSICTNPTHPLYNVGNCQLLRMRSFLAAIVWIGQITGPQDMVQRMGFCGADGSTCTDEASTPWDATQQAADQFYDRSADCSFTTFIGYEWSASPTVTDGNGATQQLSLHRNILFRNSIVPDLPTSYFEAPYPEQLYDALDADCVNAIDPGGECDVLVIPHNSNLSQGVTFQNSNPDGTPYNQQDAAQRERLERLIEVIQVKGASECLPTASDELCDFELLSELLIGAPAVEKGTIRDALKKGLQASNILGVNPQKLGMLGGTDTHLGTPGLVREDASSLTSLSQFNPGGLAVVWAPQNSRAALFDAMRRREVYATSGPRHIVRFFGGYDLPTDICSQPDYVQLAYNDGVPMGADLPAENPGMVAPRFVVSAMKDAGVAGFPGNDLQQIQIIKGWTDSGGIAREHVYNVAGDANNGAGVDINTCTNFGSGFTELCQFWEDPDFDPTEEAFYYARVIENPSCRWSQQKCINLPEPVDCDDLDGAPVEHLACCNEDTPKTVQERSWTSPIWHEVDGPPPGC